MSPKSYFPLEYSFKEALLKTGLNLRLLWVAAIVTLLELIVFKVVYPYASFIHDDSYFYIWAADHDADVSLYPIGYSKFLRLFGSFTRSDTVLVVFQYLTNQLALLWFVFTIFYFYSPGKIAKCVIFTIVIANPVFLYLANFVSSDSLFLTLSLVWFTTLLWILHRPALYFVAIQVMLLVLTLIFRYNALTYPAISTIALLLCRQPAKRKAACILAGFLAVGVFVFYTAGKYKDLSGVRQFSPFAGWQIANNAIYAYRYVGSDFRKECPPRFIDLDSTVRQYLDASKNMTESSEEWSEAGTVYMWDSRSPLRTFMKLRLKPGDVMGLLKKWALMGPLYSDYGCYLIGQYPNDYVRYYLWPNTIKYYAPPVEVLGQYNMGRDTVNRIGQQWFGYKTQKVRTAFNDFNISILDFMPIYSALVNVVFLLGLIYSLTCNEHYRKGLHFRVLILALAFWSANFCFSVFASPVTLRYQLLNITIISALAIVLVDYMIKKDFLKK